ncbi:hypothetical protein V2W45_1478560 [Cenococcum geophilum]
MTANDNSALSLAAAILLSLKVVTEGINPIVNIITVYGLNRYRDKTWTAGNSYLYNYIRTLVSDLYLKRLLIEISRRPIIFIIHSLGSIIIKSALKEHRLIKLLIYGIVGVALRKLMVNIAFYRPISKDFITKFTFKEYKTPTVLGHLIIAFAVVLGAFNAEPIIIYADYIYIVKFRLKLDTRYKIVLGYI